MRSIACFVTTVRTQSQRFVQRVFSWPGPVIRERCGCGAEFETDLEDARELLREWRAFHKCTPIEDTATPIGGIAQVEQAPDYTLPELHIGFRQ